MRAALLARASSRSAARSDACLLPKQQTGLSCADVQVAETPAHNAVHMAVRWWLEPAAKVQAYVATPVAYR